MADPDEPPVSLHDDPHAPAAGLSGADLGLGAPGPSPPSEAPRTFGHHEGDRYDRRAELGRGGMGRVRVAHDLRLGRDVALKELHAGQDPRRMAREARITARLEHPGIVPVYDAGRGPDGQPFYTMRLVQGRALTDLLAEGAQDGRRRLLRTVLQAVQAVAFAHDRGVVHGDLKPANVMVGPFGETQVVDWGLARVDPSRLAPEDDGRATMIEAPPPAGAVAGTPAYMSPQQAAGQPAAPTDDVWALGAILHEVVAGEPPFSGPSSGAVLAAVRTQAPPRLTEPPELAAIVNRALAPTPAQRYPSAADLADDLASYLDGRRVEAHEYTPLELLRRFARVWRAPLTGVAVALAAAATAAALATIRVADERDRALDAEQTAQAALAQADRELARSLVAQARRAQREGRRAEAEVLAARALTLEESPVARGVLSAFSATDRPRRAVALDLPSCEQRLVGPQGAWMLCVAAEATSFWAGAPLAPQWERVLEADQVGVSPDGAYVLAILDDKARLLDATTGQLTDARTRARSAWRGTLTAGGRWLLQANPQTALEWRRMVEDAGPPRVDHVCPADRGATTLAQRGGAVLVVCSTGEFVRYVGSAPAHSGAVAHTDEISAVALLPTADRALMGTFGGDVLEVALGSGQVVRALQTGAGVVGELDVSPSGRRVAVRGDRGDLQVWDLDAGARVTALPAGIGVQPRFVSDGRLLAFEPGSLVEWTLPAASAPRTFQTASGLADVAVSPDGTWLATAGGSGHLTLFERSTGRRVHHEQLSDRVLKGVAFSRDGAALAAVGVGLSGGAIRETGTWMEVPLQRELERETGRRVVPTAEGWQVASYTNHLLRLGPDGALSRDTLQPAWDLEAAPDGSGLVLSGPAGIQITEAGGWRRLRAESEGHVARAPAGGPVIDGGPAGVLRVLTDDGALAYRLSLGEPILDLALSHDGALAAAALFGGDVLLLSTADWSLRARLSGHEGRAAAVAFAPDDRTLVTGSWDATARAWDLSALDSPAAPLAERIEAAWGLTPEEALELR